MTSYNDFMISYEDFTKVDIRVGTISNAETLPKARKPALKLYIDFGAIIGVKKNICSDYRSL